MPTVQEVLATKGFQVHSVNVDATVLEATRLMNLHKIGALVVMHDGHVVGVFTERDVLRRVVGAERLPQETIVGEVMTTDVICCPPETDLEEVSSVMQSKRIRHLPVCAEDGDLLGMISIGDLNAYHSNNQEATIHYLSEYIYGRV